DGPDVEQPAIRRRVPPDVIWNVGELHDRFTLRERGQHPLRYAQHAEPRSRKTTFENLPPRALIRHMHSLRHQALEDSSAIPPEATKTRRAAKNAKLSFQQGAAAGAQRGSERLLNPEIEPSRSVGAPAPVRVEVGARPLVQEQPQAHSSRGRGVFEQAGARLPTAERRAGGEPDGDA